jgi:hypothetical protein
VAEERRRTEEASEPVDDDERVTDAPVGEAAIQAAIQAEQFAAVRAALSRDSGLPAPVVRKILATASAKAITALAWKANYSMPIAAALQAGPGGIAADEVLQPKNGGYPLSDSDMEWQLELSQTPADAVTPPGARRASA